MSVIKAGYRVTVHTWENDLDNRNTKVIDGLTELQTKFLTSICRQMKSKNSFNKKEKYFGNMYEPSDNEMYEFYSFIAELAKKLGLILNPLPKFNEDDSWEWFEAVQGVIYDVLGVELYNLGLTGGDFFTRVCDSYEVELVPESVELTDVTSSFK